MMADTEAPAPNSCSRSTKSTPAERKMPVTQKTFTALPEKAEYNACNYETGGGWGVGGTPGLGGLKESI